MTAPATRLADHATSLARPFAMRAVVAAIDHYPGVDADALLREVGIDRATIDDPEAVHDGRLNIELLERAAAATRDPAFGMRWSATVPWSDLAVLGYVFLHAPTIGAALGNARRYLAIQQTNGELELAAGARTATLSYHVRNPDISRHAQHSESVLALLVRGCREGTGDAAWAPRAVRLRHARPRSTADHTRFFRAPVEFGARADALVLDAAALRTPFVRADAGLLPILVAHADACLAKLPRVDDFGGQVRRVIAAAIGGGDASIDVVAAQLGTSARSLQRELRTRGHTYKALVDDTRLGLARRYLADPSLSLTETAYLLGYADLSAFSRAFRRWTGSAPTVSRGRR